MTINRTIICKQITGPTLNNKFSVQRWNRGKTRTLDKVEIIFRLHTLVLCSVLMATGWLGALTMVTVVMTLMVVVGWFAEPHPHPHPHHHHQRHFVVLNLLVSIHWPLHPSLSLFLINNFFLSNLYNFYLNHISKFISFKKTRKRVCDELWIAISKSLFLAHHRWWISVMHLK